MTLEMVILSAIIIAALVCFIIDLYPIDKVSILILSSLVLFRLVSPEEAIAGFGNSATITVGCMLALSYGIQSTGGLNYIAYKIIDRAGTSEFKILLAIIITVGILSAFINNTAAVALFLPLTIAVAREKQLEVGKFLMPMSFAAMFAGSCTLIGTSTNLLVYSSAVKQLDWEIGIFEMAPAGLIFSAVGILYLLFFAHRLLPSRQVRDSLTKEYHLRNFVTELTLKNDSPLIGLTIAKTEFREKYNVEVIEILRGTQRLLPSTQHTQLKPKDILLVQGNPPALLELKNLQGVILKALTVEDQDLEDENIVLVEAFISPSSRLIESTLKEVDFRRTFKANTLAIRSHGRTIREKIGKIELEYGDSLLILTDRKQLEVLRQTPDFLVLEEVRSDFLRKDKVYYAIGTFLVIILLATFNILSIVEAAVLGTGLMLLTGCLKLRDLYSHLSWQTIIMLACLIPLGTAMSNTGLSYLVADNLVELLRPWGPIAVLSGIYLLTSILTSIMSNSATAVLMIPISLSIASQLQVDPKPFLMSIMFAASASFMTPVGYQTNVFILGPGGYRFVDFVKVGAPLNILFWLIASFLIPALWPL